MEARSGPQEVTQEVAQAYNRMRLEYAEIFRTYIDLEEEKREHGLVVDAIKGLEPTRRCWRLIGGVLVEKNLSDVLQNLNESIANLDKASTNYNDSLKKKEKDMQEYEAKYNLRPNAQETPQKPEEQGQKEGKNTGVLA